MFANNACTNDIETKLMLVYFYIIFSYHCLMPTSTCSKVILRMRNKLAIHLEVLKDKVFMSRKSTTGSTSDAINLTYLNRAFTFYRESKNTLMDSDTLSHLSQ